MSTEKNDFQFIVDKAMRLQGRSHMRPVIEKELLHYDILFALDNAGLLDNLTFQGGTSLRLCYGAPRFSEDLDFAGGIDFESKNLVSMKSCLEDYIGKRYGLEITVKEPKELLKEPTNRNVNVDIWQLRLVTHPGQKDLPKQMIKIEVANIPAYTREAKQIIHNYDFLPDGYKDTIVLVETLNEIFADKLLAFVNCQPRIRYRDLWDFHWLKQQGAKVDMDLLKKKIKDYKVNNYSEKLDQMLNQNFPEAVLGKNFDDVMKRFLPMDVQERTILNTKFKRLLLDETLKTLDNLGFEWKMNKEKEIYCTNSIRPLDKNVFEQTKIQMQEQRDKNGLFISYGTKPQGLIISTSLVEIAEELYSDPTYKHVLLNGYRIDASLEPGQWFIKFS